MQCQCGGRRSFYGFNKNRSTSQAEINLQKGKQDMFQYFLWQLPVCIKEGVKKNFHSVNESSEENSATWGNVGDAGGEAMHV